VVRHRGTPAVDPAQDGQPTPIHEGESTMQQHPQQPKSLLQSAVRQLGDGESLATPWGACFTRSDGQVVADLPAITSVGLCNLCEVRSHEVVRVAGMVSHCVRFMDGGQLRFAYNHRGELVELHCRGVSVAVTPDGRVMAAMPGSPVLQEYVECAGLNRPAAA
jgi:hypothetical protein